MSAYSPSPMRGQSPDDEKLALEFFVPFLILLTLLAFWYYRRNRSTRIINSSRPFYSGSGSSSSSTVLPASVVKSCPLYIYYANLPGCAVCLSMFENGETGRVLTCKHCFHTGCIKRWFDNNSTCPLCPSLVQTPESVPDTGSTLG
ncbi:putative transcription factor C2H2 family [Helianthus annuus]|nr:putative transcription factor C2H2 family [Helianthus annuus]